MVRAVPGGRCGSNSAPDAADRLKGIIDSKEPSLPLKDYIYNETRYKSLAVARPEEADALLKEEEKDIRAKWRYYNHMAKMTLED